LAELKAKYKISEEDMEKLAKLWEKQKKCWKLSFLAFWLIQNKQKNDL
jgi:hypothetical protein